MFKLNNAGHNKLNLSIGIEKKSSSFISVISFLISKMAVKSQILLF